MGDNRGSPWPERDEELIAWWNWRDKEGRALKNFQIAGRMKVSRNSVIGRANRLIDKGQMQRRPEGTPLSREVAPGAGHAQTVASSHGRAPVIGIDGTAAVKGSSFMPEVKVRVATGKPPKHEAPRKAEYRPRVFGGEPTCMWPIGDVGTPGFHYCGAPGAPGLPYCAAHHKLGTTGHRARERTARMGATGENDPALPDMGRVVRPVPIRLDIEGEFGTHGPR